MKFLLDAGLPPSLVRLFAARGHAAIHVESLFPPQTPDEIIAAYAQQQRYCLIARDYDFGDIRVYPPRRYSGIVLLVVPYGAGAEYIRGAVERFLDELPTLVPLVGKLVIVDVDRIRVRD